MTLLTHDRDLLEGFRGGRRDALAQVYRHYADDVARFLRGGFMYTRDGKLERFRGIDSPFELEGAVQEVFARAFAERARLAYDGLRPYVSFLRGIAKNVALDDLRKRARRGESIEPVETVERAAGSVAAGGGVAEPHEPEQDLDERRGRELVDQFLAEGCDDRDRELFALRYREELSQEQAARRAGLTRIQVRRWESKFKARLLRHLKRNEYVRTP